MSKNNHADALLTEVVQGMGFTSILNFCRAKKIKAEQVYKLLNGEKPVFQLDGSYADVVEKLMVATGKMVNQLFEARLLVEPAYELTVAECRFGTAVAERQELDYFIETPILQKGIEDLLVQNAERDAAGPRRVDIIRSTYGVGVEEMTQKELGRRYGVTGQCISHALHKGVRILRGISVRGESKCLLDFQEEIYEGRRAYDNWEAGIEAMEKWLNPPAPEPEPVFTPTRRGPTSKSVFALFQKFTHTDPEIYRTLMNRWMKLAWNKYPGIDKEIVGFMDKLTEHRGLVGVWAKAGSAEGTVQERDGYFVVGVRNQAGLEFIQTLCQNIEAYMEGYRFQFEYGPMTLDLDTPPDGYYMGDEPPTLWTGWSFRVKGLGVMRELKPDPKAPAPEITDPLEFVWFWQMASLLLLEMPSED